MAGLGTEVGDAYIEVHASTGPFRRELRRDAALAAQDFGKRFGTALDKSVDKQLTPLGVNLRKALDISDVGFKDALNKGVLSEIKRLDDALVRASISGDFSGFVGQFGSMADATQALNKRLGELRSAKEIDLKDTNRIVASYKRWVASIEAGTEAEAKATAEKQRKNVQDKINLVLAKDQNAQVRRLTASSEKLNKALAERPVIDLSADIDQLKRKQFQDKLNALATQDHDKAVQKLSGSVGALTKKFQDLDKTSTADLTKDLGALKKSIEDADKVAKRFNISFIGGLKGSRNDFLNIIGSIGGAVEKAFSGTATFLVRDFGRGIASLGSELQELGGPLRGIGNLFDSLGTKIQGFGAGGISGLVIQIVALGAAFQGMLLIVGPFAAAISGLLAIVTALAVTIGGALLGAITLLGPPLAAAVVGVGALALAFSDLSDKQKEAFDPLKEFFNETRTAVSDALFSNMGDQVQRLTDALGPLQGVLVEVANATSEWFTRLLDGLSSGPMADSLNTLGQAIPGLFTSLLDLLTGLSAGLLGLFAASSPAAQTFLDKLNGVVDQFVTWVTSAEGQESIHNFLTIALDLMSQLWGIAKEVGSALSILFDEGNAAGSTMLRTIQDILANFNTWLGSEEGREALRQWFIDGIALLRDIGELVGSLLRLFDELDNPTTRGAFQFLIDALTLLSDWITTNVMVLNFWKSEIERIVGQVGGFFSALGPHIVRVWEFIVNRAQFAISVMQDAFKIGVDKIAQFFSELPGRILIFLANLSAQLGQAGRDAMKGLYDGIVNAAGRVIEYLKNLAGKASKAFKDALGIASPSKVFAGFGRNIGEGLAQGIAASSSLVEGAMDNLIDSSLLSNLNTPISSLAAQGSAAPGASTAGGTVIESGAITVVTPYADPRLVAVDVMDALAVRGK